MEVIEVPRLHAHREARHRARVPRARSSSRAHGLTDERLEFTDEGIATIIDNYTREAGVRGLEREIAVGVPPRRGAPRRGRGRPRGGHARARREGARRRTSTGPRSPSATGEPGVATGLAWTPGGRRHPLHRGHEDARQGQHRAHRQHAQRDAGVGAPPRSRSCAARPTALHLDPEWLQADRPPPPHPAGRHAEGRAERRRHDVHRGGVAAARLPGQARRGDDRRDLAARAVLPVGGIKEKLLAAHRAGHQARAHSRTATSAISTTCRAEVRADLDIQLIRRMDEMLGLVLEAPIKRTDGSIPPESGEQHEGLTRARQLRQCQPR